MPDSASLQQLFPAFQDIPAEYRLASPIHQRVSLVDGA
jgi:glyceraldehyde-3-phosphate dehydrogenase (NADP+)